MFQADLPAPGAEATSAVILVSQQPADGITLTVGGQPLLTLTVEYQCWWDSRSEWLTVTRSSIRVHGRDEFSRQPLLRYEYDRETYDVLPAAHLHVHGVHPALTETMGSGGDATRRSRERARKAADGSKVPQLAALHFPLGGIRFRPCLEDVLAMLLEEFGVDTPNGDRAAARRALEQGREGWRRTQVATVVRDAPAEAIRVLEQLGYDVTLRPGVAEPGTHLERLRAL